MAIEDPQLIVGLAALVAAVAALVIAVIQTAAALAQYVQVSSRCSPRVTGVFTLGAGFWFQISSLSWNPQYRMPMLTMPGLRGTEVAMEADAATADFRPGRNFDSDRNGYVDYGRLRVSRRAPDGTESIDIIPTIVFSVFAAVWSPIGLALSAVLLLLLFVPAFCGGCFMRGGCGGRRLRTNFRPGALAVDIATGLALPLIWPWECAIRYKSSRGGVHSTSSSPGLEPAAWCQFLVNFQDAWWAHASIRWEWRLATMIPLDVYSATIETTMADLQLLAAMGGMHTSSESHTIARTRCGEMLVRSHHMVLGRIVYYRSGRENIRPLITGTVPAKTSRFLQCLTATRAHLTKHATATPREAFAALLSRPRTEFDAQIPLSLGPLTTLLSTPIFKILSSGLHATDRGWTPEEARIFLGPLGQGLNGCSCLACCREWMATQPPQPLSGSSSSPSSVPRPGVKKPATQSPQGSIRLTAETRTDFWPALAMQAEMDTAPARGGGGGARARGKRTASIVGPFAECLRVVGGEEMVRGECSEPVQIETLRACRGACPDLGSCTCGSVARVSELTGASLKAPRIEEMFAAAAVNTKWLGRCSGKALAAAAGPLAEWVSEPDQEKAELRRKVTDSLVIAWAKASSPPAVRAAPAQAAGGTKEPAIKASIDLVRVVMAATEVYLLAVRKAIGANSMWDGPATEGYDDFGPVVLGA